MASATTPPPYAIVELPPPYTEAVTSSPTATREYRCNGGDWIKSSLLMLVALGCSALPIGMMVKYNDSDILVYSMLMVCGCLPLPLMAFAIANVWSKNRLGYMFGAMMVYYSALMGIETIMHFNNVSGYVLFAMVTISGGAALLCSIAIIATRCSLNLTIHIGFAISSVYFACMLIVPLIVYPRDIPLHIQSILLGVPGPIAVASLFVSTYTGKKYWYMIVLVVSALYIFSFTIFILRAYHEMMSTAGKIAFPICMGLLYATLQCILTCLALPKEIRTRLNYGLFSLYFFAVEAGVLITYYQDMPGEIASEFAILMGVAWLLCLNRALMRFKQRWLIESVMMHLVYHTILLASTLFYKLNSDQMYLSAIFQLNIIFILLGFLISEKIETRIVYIYVVVTELTLHLIYNISITILFSLYVTDGMSYSSMVVSYIFLGFMIYLIITALLVIAITLAVGKEHYRSGPCRTAMQGLQDGFE